MNVLSALVPPGARVADVLAPYMTCGCGAVHDRRAAELLPFVGAGNLNGDDALAYQNCPCGSTLARGVSLVLHDDSVGGYR